MNALRFFALTLLVASFASAQDRMPPLAKDKLTPEQHQARELLEATPRGNNGTAGPFVPLLRSPEYMNRLQKVGEYLRFKNSIPQELVEMTILMTARQWTQQYEWAQHYPLAIKAGLKTEIASAIADGRRPAGMSDDEDMVWNFNSEIAANKSVSDATYTRIARRFGEQGVIDLTGVTAYYSNLAMIMSVARTPGPVNSSAPALMPYAK